MVGLIETVLYLLRSTELNGSCAQLASMNSPSKETARANLEVKNMDRSWEKPPRCQTNVLTNS